MPLGLISSFIGDPILARVQSLIGLWSGEGDFGGDAFIDFVLGRAFLPRPTFPGTVARAHQAVRL